MRIRFQQTTPSSAPDKPFCAGQVIDVPWDKQVRYWLSSGVAVAIDGEPEAAVVTPDPERATLKRPKVRR